MLATVEVESAVHTSTFLLGEVDGTAGVDDATPFATGEEVDPGKDAAEQPVRAATTTRAERTTARGFMVMKLSAGRNVSVTARS